MDINNGDILERVDEIAARFMTRYAVPGLSLCISHYGDIQIAKGYGYADIENEVSATPETAYKIGSISKQFLAVGIIILAEEGAIALNDPITAHIKGAPKQWEAVRIINLLNHTSGLVRETVDFDPYRLRTKLEIIESTFSTTLLFEPGKDWSYSNIGYCILAQIIEAASKIAFDDFMATRVFRPAGLTKTTITCISNIIPKRARSYFTDEGRRYNAGDLRAFRPSAAFVSNVLDLALWDRALLSDLLISKSSRLMMESTTILSNGRPIPYAFGWEVSSLDGHRVVHHGGALWCFRAQVLRFVDDGLFVTVLSNAAEGDAIIAASEIAAVCFGNRAPDKDARIESIVRNQMRKNGTKPCRPFKSDCGR